MTVPSQRCPDRTALPKLLTRLEQTFTREQAMTPAKSREPIWFVRVPERVTT